MTASLAVHSPRQLGKLFFCGAARAHGTPSEAKTTDLAVDPRLKQETAANHGDKLARLERLSTSPAMARSFFDNDLVIRHFYSILSEALRVDNGSTLNPSRICNHWL
jgi:hypothetical protein